MDPGPHHPTGDARPNMVAHRNGLDTALSATPPTMIGTANAAVPLPAGTTAAPTHLLSLINLLTSPRPFSSFSSFTVSTAPSSLLAPAASHLSSAHSDFAPSDHSSSTSYRSSAPIGGAAPLPAPNPSKNRFFSSPSARSPSPGHMGQSHSGNTTAATNTLSTTSLASPFPSNALSIPNPQPISSSSASSIASSTGGKRKLGWGRRKKSEDVTALMSAAAQGGVGGSSGGSGGSVGSGGDNKLLFSGKGKERAFSVSSQSSDHHYSQNFTASSSPLVKSKPSLPIQLTSQLTSTFNVFSSRKHTPSPKSLTFTGNQVPNGISPPPQQSYQQAPPPRMTEAQMGKDLPPPPPVSTLTPPEQTRGSTIVSPSTAAAIHLLQVSEPTSRDSRETKDRMETPKDSRPSTAREKPDRETKQDWRKSDSTTISHSTIRPGAIGNRSPRPVSLAESSHSGHTIVPVNKRLSALITDAEFATPEEGDLTDSSSLEFSAATTPTIATPPTLNSQRASPASSVRARNRRSMSLNLVPASLSPKSKTSSPPEPIMMHQPENGPSPLHRTYTETLVTSSSSTSSHTGATGPVGMDSPPPTLTRTAVKGFIAPLNPPGAVHSTGSNIRGRLAAWTVNASSKRATDRSPSALTPTQPSFRQTTVSITGQTAAGIAMGIGKRAANKVTRVWGGLSAGSSSASTHSSTSSMSGTPSSYHSAEIGRSTSEQSMPLHSSGGGGGMWKRRRTPNAPSGAWSVTSSLASSSVTDFDASGGPCLGSRLRGPRRTASGSYVAGGLVFGRELETCVNDTAIDSTLIAKELGTQSEEPMEKRPLEKRLLPALVLRCAQHLLKWGVQEEGLFRCVFFGILALAFSSLSGGRGLLMFSSYFILQCDWKTCSCGEITFRV